ncbi:polygalacturonase-1 non-catalytic subunit beta, partial [Genlisea aurea]
AEGANPFTPKGYLLRYWKAHILGESAFPEFLLEKASPLTAAQNAAFAEIAGDGSRLSAKLPEFCAQAGLFCFPDLSQSPEKHDRNADFATYLDRNFSSYGDKRSYGTDSFQHYAEHGTTAVNAFRSYSRESFSHFDKFDSYGTDNNVADQSFDTYGKEANTGAGTFENYNNRVNDQNLRFATYSGGQLYQSFATYSTASNTGEEGFANYGKAGNGPENLFIGYANGANSVTSNFNSYDRNGNGGNDTFSSYGENGNNPTNNFRNYDSQGNGGTDSFTTYRNQSNIGNDNFNSYGTKSNGLTIGFAHYGESYNQGTDNFTTYGKGGNAPDVSFKIYGHAENDTFKGYVRQELVTFSTYNNDSSSENPSSGKKVVNKWVEPGKFFRESMLKSGTIMPMPDIRDKMPKRSFLPRSIASKLPFSTSKIAEIAAIFRAGDGESKLSETIANSLRECERAPSPGETKRCVSSIEDMIDFATSVLGRNSAARTTATTAGSGGEIKIGEVKGIAGGRVTKSVSCHQSLYPYLLYYCHSVPKVRVYEADLLHPKTDSKINHGVAICHIDTTSWSPDHGAFIALGPGPGKIEVCHWIFQNDMTWA